MRFSDSRTPKKKPPSKKTAEVLARLSGHDQFLVFCYACLVYVRSIITFRKIVFVYVILVGVITAAIIDRYAPGARILRNGWVFLYTVTSFIFIKYHPRRRYHYIGERGKNERRIKNNR